MTFVRSRMVGVVLILILVLLDVAHAKLADHHMSYDDIQSYHYHPCRRPCTDDEPPKVCEYDFLVEHYYTLTRACYNCPFVHEECGRPHCVAADGVNRGIITVNRMIPGPAIHVCENDTIRVRVHNKLEMSEGVTIHWHGLLQHGTPYMDGVGMVTQCPIPAHTAFTYTFTASTPGTHFWHAHSGMQRSEGVFGHLVVRQRPSQEYHHGRYDIDNPDHAVMINDWWDRTTPPSFTDHHNRGGTNKPTSILINGKGIHQMYHDPVTGQNATTPRAEFVVRQGYTYRFRLVSAGILNCPIRISIDDHNITIIASDGAPLVPMDFESVAVFPGERYDFILNANKSISSYLMRARGLGDCSPTFNDAFQTAIVRYEGATLDPHLDSPFPHLHGKQLSSYNTMESDTRVMVSELRSALPDDPAVTQKPDKRFLVHMDFNKINNPRFHNEKFYPMEKSKTKQTTPQLNHISMVLPPAPALSQLGDIPKDMYCDNSTMAGQNCDREYCECIHLLKADLGDVIELVLVDEGKLFDANHPMHLHGHGFRVVAMKRLGTSTLASIVDAMDKAGNITRNLDRPPKKDTVTVPDGGYTVLRFHANNPGMWLFHCHIEYHAEIGMAILFQVGEEYQFPPRPRRFPQCGSWDGNDSQDDHQGPYPPPRAPVGDGDYHKRNGASSSTFPINFLLLFLCTILSHAMFSRVSLSLG